MSSCSSQTLSLELTSQEVQTTESEEGTSHLADDGRAETRSTLASIDQRLGEISNAVQALPGEVPMQSDVAPMQPDIDSTPTTPTQHDTDTTLTTSTQQQRINHTNIDCNRHNENDSTQEKQ